MFTSKMLKIAFLTLFMSLFVLSANAANTDFPFTDVKESDELYTDLSLLYKNNVIKDTTDNKFRPDSLITRDQFLGIVIGVGCRDCINPTTEDFIKYDISPFVDLNKFNPYYYCISAGKENGITEGYKLDSKGEYTCQNEKTFTETPFCPENNTTRIEAVAMLLRIAQLWDNELNSNVAKDITISDIDDQWYGFAKKGIEIGILKKDASNKVHPNEYINRREFVHMATNIFGINLCDAVNKNKTEGLSSDIKIYDKENTNSCSGNGTETDFSDLKETTYDFYAYTEDKGDVEYLWEFTNTTTNEVIKATTPCLNDYMLSDGKWIIKLTIRDKNTGESSVSYSQILVNKNGDSGISGLNTDISADPIMGEGPLPVDFSSTVTGSSGSVIYVWDFGDGQTSNLPNPSHTYTEPGIYEVVLKTIDENGNTGLSQLTIEVKESIDGDNDGTKDKQDKCPTIVGPTTNYGCPVVDEYDEDSNDGSNDGSKGNEDVSSEIKVFDNDNSKSCDGAGTLSDFSNPKENTYDFYGYTESVGNFEYIWEFTNTTTNEVIKITGKCLDDFLLKSNGNWTVKLTIRDKDTGKESVSISQISVNDNATTGTGTDTGSGTDSNISKLSVNIDANPIVGDSPLPVDMKSLVSGAEGDVTYKWTFGDGQTSTDADATHIYTVPGAYTVKLTVTDSKGNTATTQMVVVVKGNGVTAFIKKDDGINNLCLSQKAKGKGTIEGLLQCNSCPCNFTIDYLSTLKECDIVFPAITSPDKKTIYGRGAVYQIQ